MAWPADFIDSYLYSPLWWFIGPESTPPVLSTGERYFLSQAIFDDLARLHFDDLSTSNQVEYKWRHLYAGTIAGLIHAAKRNDVAAAHHLLGMSMHMVQDFYSHSSWMNYPDRRDRTSFEVGGGSVCVGGPTTASPAATRSSAAAPAPA
jgi:hypothetical protein